MSASPSKTMANLRRLLNQKPNMAARKSLTPTRNNSKGNSGYTPIWYHAPYYQKVKLNKNGKWVRDPENTKVYAKRKKGNFYAPNFINYWPAKRK